MVDTAMGRCMDRLERKESEVRSWLDYLVEHARGDRRVAYNMVRVCADLMGWQGEEDADGFLTCMAEALRAGDKDEVDFTDGWSKADGNLIWD